MARTAEERELHAQLVAGVASGDHVAFEELYDEFADVVWSIARGMLRDDGRAEDATQDIWVKVWNAAGSFDPERASVATWLSTLAQRHVIDQLRRLRVRAGDQPGHEAGDEVAARHADERHDVAESAVTKVYADDVRAAMEELPEAQRRALELAWFSGYTQREISELMGKPLGTVKTYMFQGIRRLRDLLDVDSDSTAAR